MSKKRPRCRSCGTHHKSKFAARECEKTCSLPRNMAGQVIEQELTIEYLGHAPKKP